jgi:hypothetical protein
MDVISSDGTWMVHDVIDFHHVLSSDHDGTWMYIYIYGLQQKILTIIITWGTKLRLEMGRTIKPS